MAVWDNVAKTSQCPGCGAPIRYDAKTKMVICDSCGSSYDPGTIRLLGKLDIKDQGAADEREEDKREIVCDSCGAILVTDENTSATECAFCGSPALVIRRLTREFRPDKIIPFTVTKDEAKDLFLSWAKKCKYAPNDFTSEEHVNKIKGLYVPFWLIDAKCHAVALGSAFNVADTPDAPVRVMHSIKRNVTFNVSKVPFDGSRAISDRLMEAIEPFDHSKLRDYSDDYIPGFYAERYDMTALEMADRIESRLSGYARQVARDIDTGYDTAELKVGSSYVEDYSQLYALLPVWFLNYRYEGINYSFAINGQTGEAAGDIPYSRMKKFLAIVAGSWYWYALIAVMVALVIWLKDLTFGDVFKPDMLILFISSILVTAILGFTVLKKGLSASRDAAFFATNPIDSAPGVEQYFDTTKASAVEKDDKVEIQYWTADPSDGLRGGHWQ